MPLAIASMPNGLICNKSTTFFNGLHSWRPKCSKLTWSHERLASGFTANFWQFSDGIYMIYTCIRVKTMGKCGRFILYNNTKIHRWIRRKINTKTRVRARGRISSILSAWLKPTKWKISSHIFPLTFYNSPDLFLKKEDGNNFSSFLIYVLRYVIQATSLSWTIHSSSITFDKWARKNSYPVKIPAYHRRKLVEQSHLCSFDHLLYILVYKCSCMSRVYYCTQH